MDAEATVCLANIGPRQRRFRALLGVALALVGAVAAAVLVTGDLSRWARVLLFVPFYGAALCVLQAREKT